MHYTVLTLENLPEEARDEQRSYSLVFCVGFPLCTMHSIFPGQLYMQASNKVIQLQGFLNASMPNIHSISRLARIFIVLTVVLKTALMAF